PKHNVFAIQTGVAISFLVKNAVANGEPCQIHYVRRPEMETARDKLHFLAINKFKDLPFDHIQPDRTHNWINQAENDEWDELLPVGSRDTKQKGSQADAIFRLYSLGVVTARDEWVYDLD